jgi:hypothetical protein
MMLRPLHGDQDEAHDGLLQVVCPIRCKNPLCCRHFWHNSLRKLTGKVFRITGNFRQIPGNVASIIASYTGIPTKAAQWNIDPISVAVRLWHQSGR